MPLGGTRAHHEAVVEDIHAGVFEHLIHGQLAQLDIEDDVEAMVGADEKRLARMTRQLTEEIKDYDSVLFDSPPSLGTLTKTALRWSGEVLMPIQCEYFAMEGLAQLVNTIRSVKRSFNQELYIEGLLLTMFDKRNKLAHQVAEEIARHFSQHLFRTVIPRNVRLSEAP